MLSDQIVWLDPSDIKVELEGRQRQQELDVGDLIPSIREKGIMLPLLVDTNGKLVAGWRRLTAAKFLKLDRVPTRTVVAGLSELQIALIEWEENEKRKNLTWQDNASAQWRMHKLQLAHNSEWSVEQSAAMFHQSEVLTYRMLDIGEHIEKGDLGVINADNQTQATTLLQRRRERAKGEALNRILEIESDGNSGDLLLDADEQSDEAADLAEGDDEAVSQAGGIPVPGGVRGADRVLRPERKVTPPYAITHADAHDFLANYEGPRFNFLHCDLPYGVVLNGQAAQAGFEGGGYESSPDIYWGLCHSICKHWDRFMFPNSHVMFWISMKFYTETIEFFEREHPSSTLRINPTPLIWHKTDNKGIISDHLRGPRNVYEAALLMSTGDRHIVKPVSNVYGCPTAKGEDAIHTNEKPEPMLRHFFQMFVDEHSRVLDPTCGSGSSIRAAESHGAEAALGLEFNPEFAQRAQQKLVTARNLAQLSGVVNSAAASSVLDSITDGE